MNFLNDSVDQSVNGGVDEVEGGALVQPPDPLPANQQTEQQEGAIEDHDDWQRSNRFILLIKFVFLIF